MDDTTDNRTESLTFLKKHGGSCRMAYAIGDRQPVRCSLISDEPLFFMDFECEDDTSYEEAFFDFSEIDSDIAALQRRIESLSRHPTDPFSEDDQANSFALFLEEAACLGAPFVENSAPDIAFLENTLRKSRFGAALIDFAREYGTRLFYDSQISDSLYDRENGHIYLNPNLSPENRLLLAARELRRAWQHRNGALLNPLTFHPDQAILVNRAQIADLATAMVRIAWELQLSGEKEIWERLENSSMNDLARAFARESFLDFRTLNNGGAQSAAFESWFLSERCHTEDRKLIQLMLADYHGYVFDSAHPAASITADLIAALGSMPFGKNYLAPHGAAIMNDPIFTEVRDRSNANFLWFIKFERSFRETEQELQTGCDIQGRVSNSGHINNKNIRFGDHEKETEIITLPRGGHPAASSQTGDSSGRNILPFRQHSLGGDGRGSA